MLSRGLTNHVGKPVSKHGIETILRNPFYTGLIRIERTNEPFPGVHAPIISMRQFQLVQDMKAGKAGKKVTRHNHLYRGLFRCGTCDRSMIPERQKAHVYYRCQTVACPKNTIREDRLDQAIHMAYARVRISDQDAAKLKAEWLAWLDTGERQGVQRSLELRIAKIEERLSRLTDLLLDGAVDRATHDDRKHSLAVDLVALREELAEWSKSDLSEADLSKFLELVTSLTELHILLKPDEKRYLLRNCFSNLCVLGNEPVFEPYSWLESHDFGQLTPLVTQLGPLLELLEHQSISQQAEPTKQEVPHWKNNLKNQSVDDDDYALS